jgi:hypothetical protein
MRLLTTGLGVCQKKPTGMCTRSRSVSHKTNLTYGYFIHGWNLELGLSLVRGKGPFGPTPALFSYTGAVISLQGNEGQVKGIPPLYRALHRSCKGH